MNEAHEVKVLLAHLLQHLNIAITTGRAGSLDFDALMYARAATKAIEYSLGYSSQDTLDYVEAYYFMIEKTSDNYPILPD